MKKIVKPEGWHVKIPFIEKIEIFDIRTKVKNMPTVAVTNDLQTANVTIRLLLKPDERALVTLYQTLGKDYEERILPSIVNEITKTVLAQYNANQLITQREQVSRHIRERLIERALYFHILIDDVSITHLTYGKEYSAAIEAKQVAQQEAERARLLLDKANQDKRAAIARATGEARAAKLVIDAIEKNPQFIELKRIEAAKEVAHHLATSPSRIYLPSDLLILNLRRTDPIKIVQAQV